MAKIRKIIERHTTRWNISHKKTIIPIIYVPLLARNRLSETNSTILGPSLPYGFANMPLPSERGRGEAAHITNPNAVRIWQRYAREGITMRGNNIAMKWKTKIADNDI